MKVITAIGNEYLNNILKKESNIEILCNDIIYKEGILEILEKYEDIDVLIFSETLTGEIDLKELINKIKEINNKIKIIIILKDKDATLEKYLYNKGINKIIYNNKINFNKLIEIIKCEENYEENLKQETNGLKNTILENEKHNLFNENKDIRKTKNKLLNKKIKYKNLKNIQNKNYIFKTNIIKKIKSIKNIKYNKKNNFNTSSKIISILGPRGVGKSIISVNLAKANIYFKNKILILDLDFLNNSIYTIFGTKKIILKNLQENIKNNNFNNISLEEININYILSNIIKINKKIDLISGDIFLNNCENKINNSYTKEKLIKNINLLVNKLKKIYDLIIIDNSSEINIDIIKNIINISDKSIFVSDTNLLEINKSIKLLYKYIVENKININKINILFNKSNSNSINYKLLKNIFSEFKIIGYLKYNNKYNKLINKNNKINFLNKQLRKEYLKINKQL